MNLLSRFKNSRYVANPYLGLIFTQQVEELKESFKYTTWYLVEQSVDSDDLQQESPEAGDVYIYILPVTVRSWFTGGTVLSVQVVTQCYLPVRPRETVELKSNELKRDINAVVKGSKSDTQKDFNTFASHSGNLSQVVPVRQCDAVLFSFFSHMVLKTESWCFFFLSLPSYSLITPPAKTLIRICEQGGESMLFLKKQK